MNNFIKSRSGVAPIVLLILGAVLVGGGFVTYQQGWIGSKDIISGKPAEEVVQTAAVKFFESEASSYSATVNVGPDSSTQTYFAAEGFSNFKGEKVSGEVLINIDLELGDSVAAGFVPPRIAGEVELRFVDNKLYIKATPDEETMASIPVFFAGFFGIWIELDSNTLENAQNTYSSDVAAYATKNKEYRDAALEALKNNQIFAAAGGEEVETVNGKKTRVYIVSVSPEGFADFATDVARIAKERGLDDGELADLTEAEVARTKQEIIRGIQGANLSDIKVWVGVSDNLPYRIAYETMLGSGQDSRLISIELNLFDFGRLKRKEAHQVETR